jgi:dipeptidyl aminopeptidase/acylaminoacyl peptidase
MNKDLLFTLIFLMTTTLFAQKKVIDHTVYNGWKSLQHSKIAHSGNYISYEINPHRGDGFLYWKSTKSEKKDSVLRGKNAYFSQKGDVLIFSIDPGYDTTRQLKLDEVKKENRVRGTLGVFYLDKDSLVKTPNLIDFKVPEYGGFFAYRIDADSLKEAPKKKKCKLFGKRKEVEVIESNGESMFVLNPVTGKQQKFKHVVNYTFNKKGSSLTFVTHKSIEKSDSFQIHVFDLKSFSLKTHPDQFTVVTQTNYSEKGNLLAFVASNDTNKIKVHELYVWPIAEDNAKRMMHKNRSDLDTALNVSVDLKPSFSKDETRLFFGLSMIEEQEEEDSLLESEKAKLDVWHYQNKRLQPQQLLEKKRDERDSYYSVLHLIENKLIQLENDTIQVRLIDNGNGEYAMGVCNEQYAKTYNWSFPWPSDYYTVNLKTGNHKLIAREINYSQGFSPDGKYFVYFVSDSNNYYFKNTITGETDCMTCFIKDSVVWKRDINGMPYKAGPIGLFGYSSPGELVLHSKFDIWKYDFGGRKLTSITQAKGKYMNTELRIKRWDSDSIYFDFEDTYIHATDQETMDEHIYEYVPNKKGTNISLVYISNHKILGLRKAKEGKQVIFRQMNVTDYPDLYLTDVDFTAPEKVSVANPQQSEYIWPTVEKVSWTSYEGRELDGLLYKPENFDSTKNYPMLVYFYELYTQRKHNHYIPKPTASIIYATEYTSAGYVVFIPDVRYTPGHPAKSAYDCIMSGTDHVLELYPNIDSTRMGLQGQSWGGYQTAQLVTMTERYAAAMAGAPVSNMFSAYGGIRWGSGLNRAFQYERTQSRIGKTIWEAPELYIENSPLFGVPNIETPLLIMHNDGDGAVPWYQGIEMFTAMKRLNKPVWMLNYNGDQHNLMKNANRMDLSIRMRQFFDYYLQDKPAPEWLTNGVPAIEKGESYGLEEYEED